MSEPSYPMDQSAEVRLGRSWQGSWRPAGRPFMLRSRRGLLGLTIVLAIVFTALLAPLLAPADPLEPDLLARRAAPSWEHPMGLDELGRDNLSRVIYGARLSLQVGFGAVLLALAVGGLLGLLAGAWGGWLDSLITGLLDALLAFPTLLLAIVVIAVMGRGLTNALLAVALAAAPAYARLVRISVLATREQEHVAAARALGASRWHVLHRHILPATWPILLTQAMLGIGVVILEVAGLSFLGLGAEPPMPEWGAMIGQGRGAIFAAPHIVLFPGLAIMLTVLGFNLLGDGFRDALDPRYR